MALILTSCFRRGGGKRETISLALACRGPLGRVGDRERAREQLTTFG